MTGPTVTGWVLDTDAVLAHVAGDTYIRAVLAVCADRATIVLVPATVLAEAHEARPDAPAAVEAITEHPAVLIAALDAAGIRGVNDRLAAAEGNVALAHVAYLAAARGWPVLSGRSERLHAIDPDLLVEPV